MWIPVGIFNLLKKRVWTKPPGEHTLPFRNTTERFFLVGLMMPGGDFDDLWDVFFMSWILFFFLRFYLFIHERERDTDTGRDICHGFIHSS